MFIFLGTLKYLNRNNQSNQTLKLNINTNRYQQVHTNNSQTVNP